MYLTEADFERIGKLRETVRTLAPGHYSLKELCGAEWKKMLDYNSFARKFRRIVEAGALPEVKLHPAKGSNDTLVYVVDNP